MTLLDTESIEVKLRLEAKHADLAWLYPLLHTHTQDDEMMLRFAFYLQSILYTHSVHTFRRALFNRSNARVCLANKVPSLVWHFSLNELVWSQHQQAFVKESDEQNGGAASAQVAQSLLFPPLSADYFQTKLQQNRKATAYEQTESYLSSHSCLEFLMERLCVLFSQSVCKQRIIMKTHHLYPPKFLPN